MIRFVAFLRFTLRSHSTLVVALVVACSGGDSAPAQEWRSGVDRFFAQYCNDCHADGAAEGGLDLSTLESDLSNRAVFARWERIFDRVDQGEMPPEDAEQPIADERAAVIKAIGKPLFDAHSRSKGTVLRRLNRREYENTVNDLFGTHLDLAGMLPEDSRSHEFDNVGESLGLSMVHLQRYMEAATLVLDTAISQSSEAPKQEQVTASYADSREGERFIGTKWKKLEDGAVVRFSGGGYPSGMLRGAHVDQSGRYRVRVTGYAYQADKPITFSVEGTTFAKGAPKPVHGYWSFPPGKPGDEYSIEFECWFDKRYMVAIEPYGIADPKRYQRKSIDEYDGPGLAILQVEMEGPITGQWPSKGHQLIFAGLDRREVEPGNPNDKKKRWYKPTFEIVTEDERRDVSQSLRRVAEAAFRRPVNEEQVADYVDLFLNERSDGNSFEQSLRTAVTAIFCSPSFLYLQEPAGRLDDYALASRLAYFLTRTAPDEQLLAEAAAGRLTSRAGLRDQTERLLKSEHFERFLVDFTNNWLDLRDIDFTIPDKKLFPEFDAYLRYSMPRETRRFLQQLIEANLPVANIVKSDFAMLNSRLAEHYGLPPLTGSELRRVDLPLNSIRGGFLTQASVLKVTANGTNTSPVTRGAWVMERILGSPPPPPPPGVPGVEPDIRGASTLRELLDKHRDLPDCNACHKKIDPPGFALESFNPIGGYRDRYRSIGSGDRIDLQVNGRNVNYRLGPAVDSSGELPTGQDFADFRDFREHLASDQRLLATAFTNKLLTFATGRELGFSDRWEVARIVEAAAERGYGVRDLIHLVVQSELFKNK